MKKPVRSRQQPPRLRARGLACFLFVLQLRPTCPIFASGMDARRVETRLGLDRSAAETTARPCPLGQGDARIFLHVAAADQLCRRLFIKIVDRQIAGEFFVPFLEIGLFRNIVRLIAAGASEARAALPQFLGQLCLHRL